MNALPKLGDDRIQLTTFDVDDIMSSQGGDRKEKIDAFGQYLTEWGFVGVKVEGLKPLIDKAYEITQRYFQLPLEEKARRDPKMQPWEGYQALETENLSYLGTGETISEYKEAYLFSGQSRVFPIDDENILSNFHDKMGELANKILNIIQEHLNVQNPELNQFDSHAASSTTRLTRYPPMDKEKMKDPNLIWCAAHFDSSPFALLSKATASGLQLKRGEKWLNIDVADDTIVVNTGKLFQVFTAGLINPTYHRVLADERSALTGRFSIIYFPAWNSEYVIRPMESCLRKATQNMDEKEKLKFSSSLLHGPVEKIMRIFWGMAGNVSVSNEEIKGWAEQYPDNQFIKAKWPWAYASTE